MIEEKKLTGLFDIAKSDNSLKDVGFSEIEEIVQDMPQSLMEWGNSINEKIFNCLIHHHKQNGVNMFDANNPVSKWDESVKKNGYWYQ